jgi:hypothetical protein
MNDLLPSKCPTCGSEQFDTYYGSCFDNQHPAVFDARLPADPWHNYTRSIAWLERAVDSLELQLKVATRLTAERDERLAAAADRIEELEARHQRLLDAIGDPQKLRDVADGLIVDGWDDGPYLRRIAAAADDTREEQ